MRVSGKSNREIREQFGLSEKQLKNLITRHNRAEDRIQKGILPRSEADLVKDMYPRSKKRTMKLND